MSKRSKTPDLTVGWREWVALPELGIERIKAKVDTGARTSALHASDIRTFEDSGKRLVEFNVYPNQRDSDTAVKCRAEVVDERSVTNSGGHTETRYVIATELVIGDHRWPIEVTLTSRDTMKFRMLLGRTAVRQRVLVNPARSYVLGKKKRASSHGSKT